MNKDGYSALHKVAETISLRQSIYDLLVKSGAPADCVNDSGETPEGLLKDEQI